MCDTIYLKLHIKIKKAERSAVPVRSFSEDSSPVLRRTENAPLPLWIISSYDILVLRVPQSISQESFS